MRITVVTSFFLPVPPVAGGASEKIWFRLAKEFAAAGHDVTLVSRTWPGLPERATGDGLIYLRLPGFDHTRQLWRNLVLDLLWSIKVSRKLPPCDIVVCNSVTLPAYLPLFRPSIGRIVAVLGRMPKGHGYFYGGVHRLLATSGAVQSKIGAENPRLRGRTHVVLNPIDWPLHQSAINKAAPPSPLTIGYVGRLNPEKGIEILLQAAAELVRRPGLPAWRLLIIGPQEVAEGGGGRTYVESLRNLALLSGAEVSIEGPVYDVASLARIYGSLDIFCYPSLAEKGEGLSVGPIEAMAAGAVPVVSALDCYRDVIRHDQNGLVFDHRAPDRAERLADAFAGLLSDPERRRRLSANACADSRRHDYKVVAAEILDDFRSLAALAPGVDRGRPAGTIPIRK